VKTGKVHNNFKQKEEEIGCQFKFVVIIEREAKES
jgi:hypothetical protein